MPKRDPLTFPERLGRLDSLDEVLKRNTKRPAIGITCGGSSRKAKGAKVAATAAQLRQTQPGE
jgi:hypothetical protein